MNCYELQNRLVKCLFLSTELKKDKIKEKDTVMMSCGAEEFIFDKSFLSSEERLQNLGWHFYGQLNTRGRFSIMFRYVKLLSVYFSELWCHLVTCCFIQAIEDISITLLKRT